MSGGASGLGPRTGAASPPEPAGGAPAPAVTATEAPPAGVAAREGLLARAFWLHPLLAGVAPALHGFRQTKDILGPLDSWPVLAIFAGSGAVLAAVFGLLYREARWGALAASVLLVSLYLAPGLPAATWPLAWSAVALYLAAGLFLRRYRLGWPTALANLFVLLWAGLGAWQCLSDERHVHEAPVIVQPEIPAVAAPPGPDERPDLHVLILDGFGRADTVLASQGFRPGLADALGERGFLVGTDAVSPHAQTALSLGAFFSLDTLDTRITGPLTKNRRPLRRLFDDGTLLRLLRTAGYEIVSVPGEFAGSRLPSADVRRFAGCILDEYDYYLVSQTAVPTLFAWAGLEPHALTHGHRRECVKTQLVRWTEPPEGDRPAFVFAHLVLPHPPFVLRPDGSPRPSKAGTLADPPADSPTEIYSAGYHDQTRWLEREVPKAVERLVAQARRPPMIFIFGDHGAGNDLDWTHPTDAQLRERMSILSAVLVPDQLRRELGPGTGPLNVMRRIVSHVTGAPLPPLPERALFSSWHTPFEFRDVTAIVRPVPEAAAPEPR